MSDYVSEDTMIQMTTTYRRHTKTDKVKRAFNFVMKGMMMSSVMVSSFLQIGGGVAKASSLDNLDADKNFNPNEDVETAQVEVVKDVYQDESAMLLNLKNANRMLEAAVKTNQLDTWMFERVMQALVAIEARIEVDGSFENRQDLLDIILKTEDTLEASDLQNLSLESVTMKTSADKALLNIKTYLEAASGQEEITTTTEAGDKKFAYVEEDALAKGYEVFSSDKWVTGENSPRNYDDPELNALKEQKPAQQQATQQAQQTQKLSANQYKDYDSNAYWAKDMKWAVDQGLITGYQNQKHPTQPAKGVGNWIDPYGNLTEYQMLNVMLRYKDGANFESAKTTMQDKTASNFAYVEYHLANQHGIMTKGSTSNATPAKQQVTRGQMAQALVSMHYGKPVTLQQAVDFMYANGLSTGVNESKGQTLENFGANSKLARAHIVAFMGRYNEAVKSGTIKDTLNSGTSTGGIETPTPPIVNGGGSAENPAPPSFEHTKYDYSNLRGEFSTTKGFTKDGIKVSYKNHTYNTKSQAEYDQVMNYINNRIKGKTLNDIKSELSDLDYDLQVLERLMNGELTVITDRTNPASRTEENTTAYRYNIAYGDAIKSGISFETLSKFKAASAFVDGFTGGASTDWGPPESAYDFFIKNEVDCTSWAYATQAIYDTLGYNTAVVHSPGANHDYLIIELDGKWFSHESSLESFNASSVRSGDFIKFAPTQQVSQLSFISIK